MRKKKKLRKSLPKTGRFYSLWERQTRRHKWRNTHCFVWVTNCVPATRDDPKHLHAEISYQTSNSGGPSRTGWAVCYLSDYRQLRTPIFDSPL